MISAADKANIRTLAKRFGVGRVLLFGSSLEADGGEKDVDLAVEGIRPEDFFRFYGELVFRLPRPVDLVDLSTDSKFTRLIRSEGISLYDRREEEN